MSGNVPKASWHPETDVAELSRHRKMEGLTRAAAILLAVTGLVFVVINGFHIRVGGLVLMPQAYYFSLMFCYLPISIFLFPLKRSQRGKIPWFDLVAAGVVFAVGIYFFFNTYTMLLAGWEFRTPVIAMAAGIVLVLTVVECARRIGGFIYLSVCLVFGAYPLFAGLMPGIFRGQQYSFFHLISMVSFGSDGFLGIPMRVVAGILIGFIIFGSALVHSGGGKFFINIAMSLMGHVRGGPAKVSVISSALFGTISGSAAANVVATGTFTIPAMKRIGYPPHFAGAVEACASTGGILMPPVMGTAAFIMAELLQMPYWKIVIAAAVPSVLYYMSMMFQIDAYAARTDMKGIPRSECPSTLKTLKEGWFYIVAFLFLIWGLLWMKWETQTPLYATLLLLLLAQTRRETRLNWKKFLDMLEGTGKLIAEITPMILAVGLIIAGLSITGVAHSFSVGLLGLAGNNPFILVILGAITSIILGMGMPITACYVFLAIILAPSLIQYGFNPVATHLYVMYFAMASFITPPVAPAALIASGIAGAPYLKTALQSCRLGIVIFLVPFFFLYNPALILQAGPVENVLAFITASLGIFFLAGSIESYLLGVGKLPNLARPFIFAGGILLAIPGWETDLIGIVMALVTIGVIMVFRRMKQPKAAMTR